MHVLVCYYRDPVRQKVVYRSVSRSRVIAHLLNVMKTLNNVGQIIEFKENGINVSLSNGQKSRAYRIKYVGEEEN